MAKPLRILLVEDNLADAELVARELGRSGLAFAHSRISDRAALERSLATSPVPDVVISDYNLPDMRGFDVIAMVHEVDPFVPVVIVTGSISEDVAVECIKAGAADYVIKVNLTRLPTAVRSAVAHAKLKREEADRNRGVERARDFFVTLIDDFPNPVWRTEETGSLDYVNRAWLEFTGRRFEDERGDGWLDGIHPVDREAAGNSLHAYLRMRERFSLEYRLRRRDGSYHSVVSNGRPMYDPSDGHFVGYVGVCFDLEDVRRAEERERMLAIAIDASAEAIVVTDTHGVIEYVNPAYESTSGYALEELVGQKSSILKSGAHDEAFYRDLWSTVTAGQTWRGILINRKKDGTIYEEDASISPVFALDGSIRSFVGVKKDLSRERELEQRLLLAQKLDAIGRLAGGVAHDFNNLLGVISGNADLMESTLDEGHPAKPRLLQIQRAAGSAAALTRQLLAFGRRQVLQPAPADLNALLTDMIRMIGRLVPENIAIETSLGSPTSAVLVDRSQIEQVILNLALNARDAMPGGGVIRFTTSSCTDDESDAAARPFACLEVTDTGVGIAAEEMSHMFEPFFTTKAEGQGTGLGLATVYGIVRASGGEITIDSVPGRGTTFRVLLPLAPEGSAAESDVVHHAPAVESGASWRILLVEDQDMLREMIRDGLEAWGCSVRDASDADKALALAGDLTEFDLLLTDVIMPGMSGRELGETLRRQRPDLPVLFMSGYSGDVISREGILEHGIDLIQKPFTIDALMARIRTLLAQDGRPR